MRRPGVGVALGVEVLAAGERAVGDDRPEPGVVGLVGEVGLLLVVNPQLLAQGAQPAAHAAEPTLDEPLRHEGQCTPTWHAEQVSDSPGADRYGVTDGYFDVGGDWHATPDDTRRALHDAIGEPQNGPPMWFVRHGTGGSLWSPCQLVLEGGHDLGTVDALPPDLPIGYHDLHPSRRWPHYATRGLARHVSGTRARLGRGGSAVRSPVRAQPGHR